MDVGVIHCLGTYPYLNSHLLNESPNFPLSIDESRDEFVLLSTRTMRGVLLDVPQSPLIDTSSLMSHVASHPLLSSIPFSRVLRVLRTLQPPTQHSPPPSPYIL